MESIEQALEEIRALHEQLTNQPAPEITPQMFQPFPPGIDPVSYAIQEVVQLRQAVQRTDEPPRDGPTANWVPRASVYSGENGSKIVVEIPGVSKKDVAVTVSGGQLIVRGERMPGRVGHDLRPVVVEQSWGSFERRFSLPSWCTAETISARCTNGVLEIDIARGNENRGVEFQVDIG